MRNTLDCVRVVLVDDHPIVRAGIRQLLERTADITVIGESGEGQEALRLIVNLQPDVVVLDMKLLGMQGTEVMHQLRIAGFSGHILALSAYDDEDYISAVLANGAAGYLTKEEAPTAIADAIRGVAQGETGWLSRRVAAKVLHRNRLPMLSEHPQYQNISYRSLLSDRELQVLCELARGQNNQEIAQSLTIAEGTVKNHITTIYGRIGVRTRAEATAWAWQHGLLDTISKERTVGDEVS